MRPLPALLLCFAMVAGTLPSAAAGVDSLLTVWKSTSATPHQRMTAIGDYAWNKFIGRDSDSAFYYAQMQYDLAEQHGDLRQMATALGTQAESFARMGNYPEAVNYHLRSTEFWAQLGNPEWHAHALGNVAAALASDAKYQEAIAMYERCLGEWDMAGNRKGYAATLYKMGMVCVNQGNYALGSDYFTKAVRLQEELADSTALSRTYNSIGIINTYTKNYDTALDYYAKSLRMKRSAGQQIEVANTLSNMGMLHFHKKEYDKALDLFNQSFSIYQAQSSRTNIAGCLNNIGMTHHRLGQYASALDFHQRSLGFYEELADRKGITNALINLAHSEQSLGRNREAASHADRALTMAQAIGLIAEIKNASNVLYLIYKATGEDRKALAMHELYTSMRDSLMNEENRKDIMRRQFQYDYDKREALMEAEQEKRDGIAREELRRKELQRNALFGGFGLMLLLAGVFFAQKSRISKEKVRSETLLLNILPAQTAEELKTTGRAKARLIPEASVLFTDFQGFTALSEQLPPQELVEIIDRYFRAFDSIVKHHGLEKIKTIGDAYMAAGGLPEPSPTHASDTVRAALEMRDATEAIGRELKAEGKAVFHIRIGIHSGPLVAGVVGEHKFQYDIWGDTVNTASRMESSGEAGKVNISEDTYQLIKDHFACTFRGELDAKGKGKVGMYFVENLAV